MKIIVSVPHSGSHFLKKHLQATHIHHTWLEWDGLVRLCKEAEHIYVPLRHPRDIFESWGKRKQMNNPTQWYRAWIHLQALDDLFDLDIVAVDQQKDERIRCWRPENHVTTSQQRGALESSVFWEPLLGLPIISRYYNDRG
jgi:hypothetical protein